MAFGVSDGWWYSWEDADSSPGSRVRCSLSHAADEGRFERCDWSMNKGCLLASDQGLEGQGER